MNTLGWVLWGLTIPLAIAGNLITPVIGRSLARSSAVLSRRRERREIEARERAAHLATTPRALIVYVGLRVGLAPMGLTNSILFLVAALVITEGQSKANMQDWRLWAFMALAFVMSFLSLQQIRDLADLGDRLASHERSEAVQEGQGLSADPPSTDV